MAEMLMMSKVSSDEETSSVVSNKVTIVGCGQVGMACAFSLLSMNVTGNVVLTDIDAKKLKGEVMDLQQGSAYIPGCKINGGSDYEITKDSTICVITAGARQKEGQTRIDLVNQNVGLLKHIIPNLLKYSPNAIILLVTNPVDVLTYVAWKISGRPLGTVIGSGTSLDTARLKYLISEKVGINTQAIHVWIIGEHGDSSVPTWSNLQVAGVNLKDLSDTSGLKNTEKLNELHFNVVNSAYEIINLKGYTSWAIGLNIADICKSILHDTKNVHAVSTLVKGFHGVNEEVFMSLPCVLGKGGISHIIPLNISDNEEDAFVKAAMKLCEVQESVAL
ncbi:L-lactate dehydrogenase A chain [Cimex lectularius]|uniref:L-lactate dehydrogenase n=1 Tax=Cimex lectularius TaxID=79782 RepID=A0A8I6SST6_CIMLE|nr:L-lactate dehydrogenase A chain [Cimex lectularius]XP_024085199.1 L-lactate dehydrogenase A chain [Cimex lectularius]